MNKIKTKILPISLILITVVLAGVGIFTAARLYQLRNQSVAPNAPESEPGAWNCDLYVFSVDRQGVVYAQNMSGRDEPAQTADVFIDDAKVGTFNVPRLTRNTSAVTIGDVNVPNSSSFSWKVVGSSDCEDEGVVTIESPSPSPTASPSPTPTSSATPTSSPTPTATATTTSSPTPTSVPLTNLCQLEFTISGTSTPTATPQSVCNKACSTDSQCKALDSNYICYSSTMTCRHVNYPERSECSPKETSTPSAQTPTPRFECNSRCSSDSECKTIGSSYVCYNTGTDKRCRDTKDLTNTSCKVATTSASQAPVALPDAGVGSQTILVAIASISLIIVSLFLAL